MKSDYIDIKRVHELSLNDRDVPLAHKLIKLGEESGELAQAFLAYDNSKNKSGSVAGCVNEHMRILNVLEEACDTINVTMDIINAVVGDDQELEMAVVVMFDNKLDKWGSKQ